MTIIGRTITDGPTTVLIGDTPVGACRFPLELADMEAVSAEGVFTAGTDNGLRRGSAALSGQFEGEYGTLAGTLVADFR